MGYHLETPDRQNFHLSDTSWTLVVAMGITHGWVPKGTWYPEWVDSDGQPTESGFEQEECNGGYVSKEGLYVKPEDALALGEAIARAIENMSENEKYVNNLSVLKLPAREGQVGTYSFVSEFDVAGSYILEGKSPYLEDERWFAEALEREINTMFKEKENYAFIRILPACMWRDSGNLKIEPWKLWGGSYLVDLGQNDIADKDIGESLERAVRNIQGDGQDLVILAELIFRIRCDKREAEFKERLKEFVKFCRIGKGFCIS